MSDWLGLIIILLLVGGGLAGAAHLAGPPRRMSEAEYEERVRAAGYGRAGMFAFLQLWQPRAAQALEVQQDLKHGYYNKKRVSGDGADDVMPVADALTNIDLHASEQEERDA